MQIIGRPFDEQLLFNVARAYQQVTDFATRAPAL
jgi:Asp-tRNA(Asn)/Glu-tRNA(Gln) amidotransferase A subunit family amidase